MSTEPLSAAEARFRLEELLLRDVIRASCLQELGSPAYLHRLFLLMMNTLIRQGPRANRLPARLLALAEIGADCGKLSVLTPVNLRRRMTRWASLLQDSGTLHPNVLPWWLPLPERGFMTTRWQSWSRGEGPQFPDEATLREAFSDDGPHFLDVAEFLPFDLMDDCSYHLVMAYNGDRLVLEPEGVGRDGALSTSRSDEVIYPDPFDPVLLQSVPTLASLIAWLREQLPSFFGKIVDTPLFSPLRAMLARYPGPSQGYSAHVDNPGGNLDNGRTFTLTIYLNTPFVACIGGHLKLWRPGKFTTEPPDLELKPKGGRAALFDARKTPHQVGPIGDGNARWALTHWVNDRPLADAPPLPDLGLSDLLIELIDPWLPMDHLLLHQLDDVTPRGHFSAHHLDAASPNPNLAAVATVYGASAYLENWCHHHLAVGCTHLILIFDHAEQPEEAACAARLASLFGDRLTIWKGSEVRRRWPSAVEDARLEKPLAVASSGNSSHAVAARQMLGASVALRAAQRGEFPVRIDWLMHLDGDELLLPLGRGRGGSSLGETCAAADAAGLIQLRFLNHELLHAPGPLRFKCNPRLARARLGATGWQQMVSGLHMAQTDARPFFTGYFNGKAAVKVSEGLLAAGVHGWFTRAEAPAALLAGPVVLHFHFLSADAFCRKYLAIADAPLAVEQRLFEPSPVEQAVIELIDKARRTGDDEATVQEKLVAFHAGLTHFDNAELAILEEADLLFSPRLAFPLLKS